MIENMPDHDPRALAGFALIAERKGDNDTARVLRAAAAEIERLRDAAEDVFGPWSCGEPLDREMRALGRAIGMKLDPA